MMLVQRDARLTPERLAHFEGAPTRAEMFESLLVTQKALTIVLEMFIEDDQHKRVRLYRELEAEIARLSELNGALLKLGKFD